ncbi:MAG: helix-turn-helix domain-containing protein [Bacteroidales bacterium]|jgi:transcriptional regulator with XRE-family HTH domain|nr:helix-turn-helix domain-containing protein [Bacteroidales bacterium]
MNKFGSKLRELRESKGLLLRQVAAYLETDTAFVSKLERNERKAKREQVLQLAILFESPPNDLLSLWLSDQIYELVNNEEVAVNSLKITLKTIENK